MQGRIKTRSWDDKEGSRRYATEVHVYQFDLPEKPKGMIEGAALRDTGAEHESFQPTEDDIPF